MHRSTTQLARAAWLSICIIASGCGDNPPPEPPPLLGGDKPGGSDETDASRSLADGGSSGGTAGGGSTGNAAKDAAVGPTRSDAGITGGMKDGSVPSKPASVSIKTPKAAQDPSTGVVTGTSLDVACVGIAGSTALESTGVIKLFAGVGSDPLITATANAAAGGEYTTKLNLASVPSGAIRITCSVKDKSVPPVETTAEVLTFLDAGPAITFLSHKAGEIVGVGQLTLEFDALPTLLAASDTGSTVVSVAAKLNGVDVTPTPVTGKPGRYRYVVTYTEFGANAVVPTQLELAVTATNGRTPSGTSSVSKLTLVVDGTTPTIEVKSPANNAVIGVRTPLRITAIDGTQSTIANNSGTDPTSVRVVVGTETYPMQAGPSNTYEAFLPPELLKGSQISISFQAADRVGNVQNKAVQVYVDTVPPWVSMNPPTVREVTAGASPSCSLPFDPLGVGAAGDLAIVTSLRPIYRAIVWERQVPSTLELYSGVDDTTVAAYVQRNPSVSLLIDTDNDGSCDAVNSTPALSVPTKIALSMLTSGGGAPSATTLDDILSEPSANGLCLAKAGSALTTLCGGTSDMYRVVTHTMTAAKSVIYGASPGPGAACTGAYSEDGGPEGWRCVMTAASDGVGNLGLSMPIRVCLDADGDGSACPTPPPTCYSGCTMPTLFSTLGMPRVIGTGVLTVLPPPSVKVVSPTATSNPNTDGVLTGNSVQVTCEVVRAPEGDPVNTSLVTASVYTGSSSVAVTTVSATQTPGTNQYRATLNLTGVAAGQVRVRCSAQDTHAPARVGAAEILTVLDRGPSITFANLLPNAYVPRASFNVDFDVAPAPFGASDPGASIASVTATLNGVSVTPTLQSGTRYRYTVTYNELGPTPPTQLTFAVTATNARSPVSATATNSLILRVDGVAPTLAVTKPTTDSLVGDKVKLEATISDTESGIDGPLLAVEVDTGDPLPLSYPLLNVSGSNYTGILDANTFAGRSQLTLRFVAYDRVGNLTSRNVPVYLDTAPPWISLDPPRIREVYTGASNTCSVAFDPLGQSLSDGQITVSNQNLYRALIWERAVSAPTLRYSGVDNTKATLYVQRDMGTALLIDTNADGSCDAINANPASPGRAPVRLDLGPLTKGGTISKATSYDEILSEPSANGLCVPTGSAGTSVPLCAGSDLPRVVNHVGPGNPSAIYAASPTAADCSGHYYEDPGAQGWRCVAASAADLVGNVSLSAPLRICYDADGDGSACPLPAPTCTANCTMPAKFSALGMPSVLGDNLGSVGVSPSMSMSEPAPATDPNTGTIITTSKLDVVCQLSEGVGGNPIDPNTVRASVYSGTSTTALVTATATTIGNGQFKATIDLATVPAGSIRVRCSGQDTSSVPRVAVKDVNTFYDKGPSIVFVSHAANQMISNSNVAVDFNVIPVPLAGDSESGVALSQISATVDGVPAGVQAVVGTANRYRVVIPGRVTPPASSVVAVLAANSRTPVPASTSTSITLRIDGVAPVLSVAAPAQNSLVGGRVTLTANVSDALAGVAANSVFVSIDSGLSTDAYPLTLVNGTTTTYTGSFSALNYPDRTQRTLRFYASDTVGNTSSPIDVVVELDTVAPWVSLDPPHVREVYPAATTTCSVAFDPLGSAALNDKAVTQSFQHLYRALVWERAVPSGAYGGVSASTVDLYVQRSTAIPLVVDTNQDGLCDAVNVTPASGAPPVKLDLSALTPAGSLLKAPTYDDILSDPNANGVCAPTPTGTTSPLCSGASDMYRVLNHDDNRLTVPSIVYGYSPTPGSTCTGSKYEDPGAEGWRCAVATASDSVGNMGISVPLRVCVDADGDGSACPQNLIPSCLGSCTMPSSQSLVGMPRLVHANGVATAAGPEVAIITPTEAADPDTETVVTSALLAAKCSAAQVVGGATVDATQVKLSVYAGTTSTASTIRCVTPNTQATSCTATANGDGTFTAQLDLSNLAAGPIRVRCQAQDTHVPARFGSDEISTLFDKGPSVVFTSPAAGSIVGTADKLLTFDVSPNPLTLTDLEADINISQVSATLNGIVVNPVHGTGNSWSYTVTYDEFGVVTTLPNSLTFTVTSRNQRTPIAAQTQASLQLSVDQTAPVITITSPRANDIVGGQVTVTATITDALAGVDDPTVTIGVNDGFSTDAVAMYRTVGTSTFQGVFQAGSYPNRSQLTINVYAVDKVNNGATASALVYLDTVAPFVSLDPRNIRIGSPDCAGLSFDPVGDRALNDQEIVSSSQQFFRALVWERTVAAPLKQFAGVNNATVAFYIQQDSTAPLLVDKNGDGVCDIEVNPAGSSPPVKVNLSPIAPIASCSTKACGGLNSEDMSYVLKHDEIAATTSAVVSTIFGISPSASGAGCTGTYYQQDGSSGWRCVVATATDAVGNIGISKPIAVCYGGATACASAPAPVCSSSCTLQVMDDSTVPLTWQ